MRTRFMSLLAAMALALSATPATAAPRPIKSLEDFITKDRAGGCLPTLFNYGSRGIERGTLDCESRERLEEAFAISERLQLQMSCETKESGRFVCVIIRHEKSS